MKVLKFKAYHRKERRWLGVNLHLDADGLLWRQCGESSQIIDIDDRENIELLQFTGLKDKNGTEIYEGHFVKCVYTSKGFYFGRVVFTDGAFCLCINNVPRTKKGEGTDYDVGQTPELHNFDYIEVIGNVFDSPNLLKEKPEGTR